MKRQGATLSHSDLYGRRGVAEHDQSGADPDHFRGRVAAVNSIFTMGGPQLGQCESGVVAALWSPEVSALTGGLGALLVVCGVAAVSTVRHFRLADDATQLTGESP